MKNTCCLVLFTKPAVAGRVKTRLIGELNPEQAAELHATFLADITAEMERGPFEFQIAWGVRAEESLPESTSHGFRQEGATLGERLLHGLRFAGRKYPLVAALGSDHPTVSAVRISEAFSKLARDVDIVIGPATDGGYYTIGARASALTEALFDEIPWSTPNVLSTTLQRCSALGLRVHLLPEESDVDTPEDLVTLCKVLSHNNLHGKTTRTLLSRWGLLDQSRKFQE